MLTHCPKTLIFGSTANHNPSVYMPIPNRYYEQVRQRYPDSDEARQAQARLRSLR